MLDRRNRSAVVRLVDQEVMTFHVNPAPSRGQPTEPGFVVVQTHTQLHRVQASPRLDALLHSGTKSPSTDVMVSRSTGIVVAVGPTSGAQHNGQFDYFAAMLSVVQSNAKVLSAYYPLSGKALCFDTVCKLCFNWGHFSALAFCMCYVYVYD